MNGRRTAILAALAWALVAGPPACSGGASSQRAASSAVFGDPGAVDPDVRALVEGNTRFALDLYRQLDTAPGNLFFSPYSLSTALGMTYAGARGDTASQMAGALHFNLSSERLHPAFADLAAHLASRGADASAHEEGERFQLSVANALWAQDGYPFLDDFIQLEREYYGAEPHVVDFVNDAAAARITINRWVAEQTRDRIPELLPPGVPSPDARLVLTNAIYFNASWDCAFPEELTADGPFHAPSGDVTVPLMRVTAPMAWGRDGGVTVVDVPYLGRGVAMTILLPDEGELADLEEELDLERLGDLLEELEPQDLDLTLPRFESGSALELAGPLRALGMLDAFDPFGADLSGMDGSRDLYIAAIIHQANLTVDESGTEAAAATAVLAYATSAGNEPPPPRRVVIDRPFVYLIRDLETGSILFMGRLLDPS